MTLVSPRTCNSHKSRTECSKEAFRRNKTAQAPISDDLGLRVSSVSVFITDVVDAYSRSRFHKQYSLERGVQDIV